MNRLAELPEFLRFGPKMEPQTPEITVIVSTYANREFIPKKLDEIRAQTAFERAEFLFIEPDSPERERDLIEPFCAEHANCRLLALDDRINLYQAWNLGWAEARAPLLCISNVDDSMHPKLLNRVISDMKKSDWDLATVLIAKQPIDGSMNDWSFDRILKLPLSKRPGPFFVWRKSLIESLGRFDESLEIVGDKDFWARAQAKGLRLGLIPLVGYLNTFHSKQLSKSGNASEKKRRERRICSKKGYPHVWPVPLCRNIRLISRLWRLPVWRNRYQMTGRK